MHMQNIINEPFHNFSTRTKSMFQIFLYGNNLASLHATIGINQLPTFLGGAVDWEADWRDFVQKLMANNEHYKGKLNQLINLLCE